MENNENKPMPEDPKPTDDVQLNIETVIPETEKAVVPNDVTSERSKEPEIPADSEEKSEDSGSETAENPAVDEVSKDEGQSDDARDEVETVT
ncbi:MAG: hypothetical protein EOO07_16045 [Chitinophagaceae bacterium]|nr:MAG: hypothetical protein EOO07_16045 [Chitinophagaceae bacterium]